MERDLNRWDRKFFDKGIEVNWSTLQCELWIFGNISADLSELTVKIRRIHLCKDVTCYGSKDFVDQGLPELHRNYIYSLGREVYPFLYD